MLKLGAKWDDENLIRGLLSELRNVLYSGDLRDCERNSVALCDAAARRLGFETCEAFEIADRE